MEADNMSRSEEEISRDPPVLPGLLKHAKIMNQIRKWGRQDHHFNGKDPLTFLEQTEELHHKYGYNKDLLLLGLPLLLQGNALLWYRNNRETWTTWDDFCNNFKAHSLPPRYQHQLRRDIQSRYQQPNEPFQVYATAVLIMMHRAGGYSAQHQAEQLYENMNPEYKFYVRFTDTTSMDDLSTQAAQFEAINRHRKECCPESPLDTNDKPVTAYSRDECCWRCKQRGHTRQDCKCPPKKFCSRCGKDNVLSRDCHPPKENAKRARNVRPSPDSI